MSYDIDLYIFHGLYSQTTDILGGNQNYIWFAIPVVYAHKESFDVI